MKNFSILLLLIITPAMILKAQIQRDLHPYSMTDGRGLESLYQLMKLQPNWPSGEFLKEGNQHYPGSLAWKWDTVLCYNELGNIIERQTQTFDVNGNVLLQLTELFQNGSWCNLIRSSYTNDINGRILNVLTEQWQGNSWINLSYLTVSYDPFGHIQMESVEIWQTGAWSDNFRRSYTYDITGKKLTMLQERWKNGTWSNDLRTIYTYDAFGYLHTLTMEYSDLGGPWQPGGRFTYSSDMNGYWIECLFEEWLDEAWMVAGKINYSHDIQGNILSETFINWQEGNWVNDSRKSYTYDANGNATSGKNEAWLNNSWQPDMQSAYLYFKKEIILILNIDVYRYSAHYRFFISSTEDGIQDNNFFALYPNPAGDLVTVSIPKNSQEFKHLNVYNAVGKSVKSISMSQGRTILNFHGLPDGIYMITLKGKDRTYFQKLIIYR